MRPAGSCSSKRISRAGRPDARAAALTFNASVIRRVATTAAEKIVVEAAPGGRPGKALRHRLWNCDERAEYQTRGSWRPKVGETRWYSWWYYFVDGHFNGGGGGLVNQFASYGTVNVDFRQGCRGVGTGLRLNPRGELSLEFQRPAGDKRVVCTHHPIAAVQPRTWYHIVVHARRSLPPHHAPGQEQFRAAPGPGLDTADLRVERGPAERGGPSELRAFLLADHRRRPAAVARFGRAGLGWVWRAQRGHRSDLHHAAVLQRAQLPCGEPAAQHTEQWSNRHGQPGLLGGRFLRRLAAVPHALHASVEPGD